METSHSVSLPSLVLTFLDSYFLERAEQRQVSTGGGYTSAVSCISHDLMHDGCGGGPGSTNLHQASRCALNLDA